MDVQEFHKARRMYIVIGGGTLLIAPENDERTHQEWLSKSFGVKISREMLARCTRGYILDKKLVAYHGRNFAATVSLPAVMRVLDLLGDKYQIETVGFGATPSKEQPWPSIFTRAVKALRVDVTMEREAGIQAIIDLQALVGTDTARVEAAAAWDKFSESSKRNTLRAHAVFCRKEPV